MQHLDERLTILLVEDDEDDFVITRDLLRAQDRIQFEVEWASSYDAARAIIEERQHDVYLIDYRLGAKTGLDLIRDALPGGERAPVILLTGQGDYEVDLEATLLGVTDFILKSKLETSVLERSIRYAVRHHRALRQLRQTEERYALAVRGANDGVWDWDVAAGTVYYAPRWKEMLGYAADDIGTGPEEWRSRVHPDDRAHFEHAAEAHLAGRAPHFESEHRMRHADGGYRWMFSRGVAIRDAEGKATRMAGSMSDITIRKAAEERLVYDALHDALTGLPNRALFLDRLAFSLSRARRQSEYGCAVVFLDLDRFKVVNDGFSHAVGDQLLVALARRLSLGLRVGDTVARLGGDEFTVLLDDITTTEEALTAAERIQEALAEPFRIEGHELVITGSIGVSLSDPSLQPTDMMRNADIAMYDAKRDGKDRTAVFNVNMHSRVVSELQLEAELREAIEQKRLRVFYQPIVDLAGGRISGFEALARWPSDSQAVGPEVFIKVAEDTGLIGALARLVFGNACRQMTVWRAEGLVDERATMSVNVSRGQLLEGTLVEDVTGALASSGLPAECLRLEITESTIMHDPHRMRAALEELEGIGVRAQIDDFGTGYSSLTFLHHFPGDTLKIDRSFIGSMSRDAGISEIVRATITLAHNLGLSVVAEGVEEAAEMDALRQLGCEYGQGFLWSRALDAADIGPMLRRTGMGTAPAVAGPGPPV